MNLYPVLFGMWKKKKLLYAANYEMQFKRNVDISLVIEKINEPIRFLNRLSERVLENYCKVDRE